MIATQKNDELKIYRGQDYIISDHIVIHQATLDDICEYGEQDYYSMVYQLTATPQSMKYQLWKMGVDYTTVSPFELFYSILYRLYSQEKTSILFGSLDLTRFQIMQHKENESVFLYQEMENQPVIIDEFTYDMMMDYLCQVHMIQRDEKKPANETTKMILIEDARDDYEKNKNKEYHSQLKNMISAMVNCEGFKYNHSEVWNMKINAFMDSVRRVSKIKNANLLLQSGYSGFGINLKEISNKQLDWLGELE